MKNIYKLLTALLCAGVMSASVVSCSSDDENSNKSSNPPDPNPAFEVIEEQDVNAEDMMEMVYTGNEENALPEDLAAQQSNKEDLEKQLQELNDQISGGNGTYHRNVTYKVVTLKYNSIDGNGDPITLSGKLTLPQVSGNYVMIEDFLLNCHATNMDFTGNGISNAMFKEMAAYSFAVLDPDYIGFGVTNGKPQTYLCQKLIARQCVDMELAAIEYMKQQGIKFKDGYGTYVTGYSQGGGNAMAVGRHLQVTSEGREANKQVKLKGLYCGAGPYSPIGTFQHWLESDSLCLTAVLSMVIKGQQEGHSDIMKGIQLTSYFSDEYLASGVPQAFDENDIDKAMHTLLGDANLTTIKYPDPEVKTAYENLMGVPWMQFSKIMSDEFKDPNSHIRQALLQCLEMERVDDWTPTVPVEIYTAPRDNVIPVKANAISVYEKFKNEGAPVTLSYAGSLANHITAQIAWTNHVKGILKNLE